MAKGQPMSEAQKAAMKAGREAKKAQEAQNTEPVVVVTKSETTEPEPTVAAEPEQAQEATEHTYTQDEVERMIAEATARAVQEAIASVPQTTQQPQIIHVATDAPVVKLLYQSECSPVNVIQFGVNGKFGSITGQRGTFSVPKESFAGEFRDELVQNLLASRELIVLDGLTDDERDLYGLAYRKGEYLDEKAFVKIIDMGYGILDIFPDLCQSYREMVAKRYAAEYDKNPKGMNRDLIIKLNEISKRDYADLPKEDVRRKGAFYAIIEAMNRADEQEV